VRSLCIYLLSIDPLECGLIVACLVVSLKIHHNIYQKKIMLFPVQTTALLFLGAACGILCTDDGGKEGCLADNCARAVTGTRYASAVQASHRADCSSFLLTTVTPAPM
jgi:hypothetical protein